MSGPSTYLPIFYLFSFVKTQHCNNLFSYIENMFFFLFSIRCFERVISFPECSMMKVRIMDYDRIGKNELIGETTIDIESRYFSKHRAHCGLPKQYNK